MKKLMFTTLSLFALALLFLNNAGGYGSSSGEGLTGAPGDATLPNGTAKTCQACHNGGSFNPTAKIELFDEAGITAVTKYEPNKTYTIRLTITAGSGSPSGYGFQMIDIRKSNNANVKGFLATAQQATGIQVTTISNGSQANRTYAEHNSRRASNIFNVKWKAPASGTGAVTFYAVGNAVNGSSSDAGDNGTGFVSIDFAELTSSMNELATQIDMKVFPNPTTENISIQLNSTKAKNIQIRLTDITGKLVLAENWQIQAGDNAKQIPIAQIAKGAYMVQLVENQDIISKKIIKL